MPTFPHRLTLALGCITHFDRDRGRIDQPQFAYAEHQISMRFGCAIVDCVTLRNVFENNICRGAFLSHLISELLRYVHHVWFEISTLRDIAVNRRSRM